MMGTAVTDPAWSGVLGVIVKKYIAQFSRSCVCRWTLLSVLFVSLGACSTLSSTPSVTVAADRPIALLPFENLSITPQADTRLRRVVETRLRRAGVGDVYVYEATQQTTLKALLNPRRQMDDATRWANEQGAQYAFTGTVHEWQYKAGADREPVVGLTLSLIDLNSGDVLWQGNAARTGWGYANLSAIAEKTVDDLLSQVKFSEVSQTGRTSRSVQ